VYGSSVAFDDDDDDDDDGDAFVWNVDTDVVNATADVFGTCLWNVLETEISEESTDVCASRADFGAVGGCSDAMVSGSCGSLASISLSAACVWHGTAHVSVRDV
jgi:hypothetical protein